MKNSTILLITLFVIFCNQSIGQDEKKETWEAFKIDPSGMFDMSNPTVQLGFEFSMGPSWTFQMEGGPILKNSILTRYDLAEDKVSHKGYRFGFEIRHFVQEEYYSPFHGVYVGGNFYFLSNEYTDKTFWGTEADVPETYEFDFENTNWRTTQVKKQEMGFTLRCGHQLESKIPLEIEVYTGLGVKRKMVNYSRISTPIYANQVQIEDQDKGAENEGTYFRLSIPIGIRLIIKL